MQIAIVGGGAAGLAAAIFAARKNPAHDIAVLDGARKIGAKILVSGGGRCNVTNVSVDETAFFGGSRNTIRRILRHFPADAAVEFFREIGVPLHEEEYGKLFPDSNSARTVLNALLREAEKHGVKILESHRVHRIEKGFRIHTSAGERTADRVVLATGGRSVPKTGSDGAGYGFAESLGHTLVPTTPALEPLCLDGGFHSSLSGISQDVELRIGKERIRGPLLWTHFGVSGPAPMDASRLWHATKAELRVNFVPGEDFESMDRRFRDAKGSVRKLLSTRVPKRVAEAMTGDVTFAHLSREERHRLVRGLVDRPLPVRRGRGWNYAEVTAGGVTLGEVDPKTMESRRCPGLYLVGEILDVDGRIGGYNFQWAWSTGRVFGDGQ